MGKSAIIIAAVAVVAVVAIAGVAVVLMNNNSEDNRNAKEMADDFVKKYDKSFGEFTVSDDSTAEVAKLSATVKTLKKDGTEAGKDRTSNIEIHHYETKDDAEKAFNDFITNSKNGTKGKTLLTQTDVLGMAKSSLKIYDLRTESASDFGADHAYIFYAAYLSDTNAQYTQCAGALLDGKNVIVFNQTSNMDIYLNKAINESPATGEKSITVSEYETMLKNLCKAF